MNNVNRGNEEGCGKCRYGMANKDNGGWGCRRYPPQTHFIIVLRQSKPALVMQGGPSMVPVEEQRSAYPPVKPDWWCGEFAPAIALTS